jgi:hypothetical protein
MAAESHSTAMRKAVGTNVEDQLKLLGISGPAPNDVP